MQSSQPLSLPVIPSGGSSRIDLGNTLDERFAKLEERLDEMVRDGLVVAFSGGVDSAFLVWAAGRAAGRTGGNVVALTTVSDSMPSRDLDDSVRFAEDVGVEHVVVRSAELQDPAYVRNGCPPKTTCVGSPMGIPCRTTTMCGRGTERRWRAVW